MTRWRARVKRKRGEKAKTAEELDEMEREATAELLAAPRQPAHTFHHNCGLNTPGEEHDERMCTHVYY